MENHRAIAGVSISAAALAGLAQLIKWSNKDMPVAQNAPPRPRRFMPGPGVRPTFTYGDNLRCWGSRVTTCTLSVGQRQNMTTLMTIPSSPTVPNMPQPVLDSSAPRTVWAIILALWSLLLPIVLIAAEVGFQYMIMYYLDNRVEQWLRKVLRDVQPVSEVTEIAETPGPFQEFFETELEDAEISGSFHDFSKIMYDEVFGLMEKEAHEHKLEFSRAKEEIDRKSQEINKVTKALNKAKEDLRKARDGNSALTIRTRSEQEADDHRDSREDRELYQELEKVKKEHHEIYERSDREIRELREDLSRLREASDDSHILLQSFDTFEQGRENENNSEAEARVKELERLVDDLEQVHGREPDEATARIDELESQNRALQQVYEQDLSYAAVKHEGLIEVLEVRCAETVKAARQESEAEIEGLKQENVELLKRMEKLEADTETTKAEVRWLYNEKNELLKRLDHFSPKTEARTADKEEETIIVTEIDKEDPKICDEGKDVSGENGSHYSGAADKVSGSRGDTLSAGWPTAYNPASIAHVAPLSTLSSPLALPTPPTAPPEKSRSRVASTIAGLEIPTTHSHFDPTAKEFQPKQQRPISPCCLSRKPAPLHQNLAAPSCISKGLFSPDKNRNLSSSPDSAVDLPSPSCSSAQTFSGSGPSSTATCSPVSSEDVTPRSDGSFSVTTCPTSSFIKTPSPTAASASSNYPITPARHRVPLPHVLEINKRLEEERLRCMMGKPSESEKVKPLSEKEVDRELAQLNAKLYPNIYIVPTGSPTTSSTNIDRQAPVEQQPTSAHIVAEEPTLEQPKSHEPPPEQPAAHSSLMSAVPSASSTAGSESAEIEQPTSAQAIPISPISQACGEAPTTEAQRSDSLADSKWAPKASDSTIQSSSPAQSLPTSQISSDARPLLKTPHNGSKNSRSPIHRPKRGLKPGTPGYGPLNWAPPLASLVPGAPTGPKAMREKIEKGDQGRHQLDQGDSNISPRIISSKQPVATTNTKQAAQAEPGSQDFARQEPEMQELVMSNGSSHRTDSGQGNDEGELEGRRDCLESWTRNNSGRLFPPLVPHLTRSPNISARGQSDRQIEQPSSTPPQLLDNSDSRQSDGSGLSKVSLLVHPQTHHSRNESTSSQTSADGRSERPQSIAPPSCDSSTADHNEFRCELKDSSPKHEVKLTYPSKASTGEKLEPRRWQIATSIPHGNFSNHGRHGSSKTWRRLPKHLQHLESPDEDDATRTSPGNWTSELEQSSHWPTPSPSADRVSQSNGGHGQGKTRRKDRQSNKNSSSIARDVEASIQRVKANIAKEKEKIAAAEAKRAQKIEKADEAKNTEEDEEADQARKKGAEVKEDLSYTSAESPTHMIPPAPGRRKNALAEASFNRVWERKIKAEEDGAEEEGKAAEAEGK